MAFTMFANGARLVCGFLTLDMSSTTQQASSLPGNPAQAHNTYSGGMINIYAACRVSESVLKSHGVLLHYEMAYTLSFCYGPVKGPSVQPRAVEPERTTLIFMQLVLMESPTGTSSLKCQSLQCPW